MIEDESIIAARAVEMLFLRLMLEDFSREMTASRGTKSWMAEVERM